MFKSEVRGGSREELPRVRGQWRPRGDTPRPRSGQPGEATSRPRSGAVTLRSHAKPEARGGSWEEPPTPEARAGAGRSNPRSGGCAAQEGLEELSHVEGQERWR